MFLIIILYGSILLWCYHLEWRKLEASTFSIETFYVSITVIYFNQYPLCFTHSLFEHIASRCYCDMLYIFLSNSISSVTLQSLQLHQVTAALPSGWKHLEFIALNWYKQINSNDPTALSPLIDRFKDSWENQRQAVQSHLQLNQTLDLYLCSRLDTDLHICWVHSQQDAWGL